MNGTRDVGAAGAVVVTRMAFADRFEIVRRARFVRVDPNSGTVVNAGRDRVDDAVFDVVATGRRGRSVRVDEPIPARRARASNDEPSRRLSLPFDRSRPALVTVLATRLEPR